MPAKVVGHLALLLDGGKHRLAAFVKLLKFDQQVANGGDLHLVEASRHLLTITSDKRHRSTLFKEFYGLLYLSLVEFQSIGNNDSIIHILQRYIKKQTYNNSIYVAFL